MSLPDHGWPTDDGTKKRIFMPLPLACHRMPNPDYVFWHATDTILKDIYSDPEKRDRLTLLTNTGCQYLEVDDKENAENSVMSAKCYDHLHSAIAGDIESAEVIVEAEYFVIAAGAVGTPQVCWAYKTETLPLSLSHVFLRFCPTQTKNRSNKENQSRFSRTW